MAQKNDSQVNETRMAEAYKEPPDPRFWLELIGIMGKAAEISQREPTTDADHSGRSSAWFTTHQIAALLLRQPYFMRRPELCTPLLRLSSALSDLDQGRVSPVLKPSKGPGHSPGQPSNLAILKGTAARALGELIDGGKPALEAAETVAKALQTASKKGLGEVTRETVKNWRERLEQGQGPGAPEAALFAYQRAMPIEMGATALERGNNLVAALRKQAAELI